MDPAAPWAVSWKWAKDVSLTGNRILLLRALAQRPCFVRSRGDRADGCCVLMTKWYVEDRRSEYAISTVCAKEDGVVSGTRVFRDRNGCMASVTEYTKSDLEPMGQLARKEILSRGHDQPHRETVRCLGGEADWGRPDKIGDR